MAQRWMDSSEAPLASKPSKARDRQLLPLAILAIPVAIQVVLIVRNVRSWTPIWAWYADPGYQYLLAGGALVSGGDSRLVEHPGLSLQWFIGTVELLSFLTLGSGSLRSDLVERPEFYAQIVSVALGLLFVAAVAFAALRFLRFFGLVPALIFQLLLLWGLPIMAVGRFRLMPESLVLTSSVAILAVCAPVLCGFRKHFTRSEAIALGALAAVGITAKVLFAPILLLVLLLIGKRHLLAFAVAFVMPFLMFMLPTFARLDYMFNWYRGLLFSPGRQGQQGSWAPTESFVASMAALGGFVRWFVPVIGVILLLTAIVAFITARSEGLPAIRPILGLLIALGFVILASLKPAEVRDFLLAIPLLAALSSTVYSVALTLLRSGRELLLGIPVVALGAFLAAHGIVASEYLAAGNRELTATTVKDAEAVAEFVEDGHWALGYNVWTIDNALMYSIDWTPDTFGTEMQMRSPDALYFNIWGRNILGLDGKGKFGVLDCEYLQSIQRSQGLGIIVESTGHLAANSAGGMLELQNALVEFGEVQMVADYFAYPVLTLNCPKDLP